MGKHEKLVDKILSGNSDSNITFDDLCGLLLRFEFDVRVRGSHHIFRRDGIDEKINLQHDGNHAKPYQVRQVRNLLLKYKLTSEESC